MASRDGSRPMMIFDADCAFCSRSARWVQRRLSVDVDVVAMPAVDLLALGIDPTRARREMPFVAADGRVSYGHLAWADVLLTGGPVLRVAGRLVASRVLRPAASAAYGWVAANRHRLPGSTASCELPPTRR